MTGSSAPVADELRRSLGHPAEPLTPALLHPNLHFRAGPYFVKVFTGRRAYYEAEVAAAAGRSPQVRAPRIRDVGVLADGRPWAAFDWHDLEPVAPDTATAEAAGHAVGVLHAGSSRAEGLRSRSADLRPAVLDLARRTAGFDRGTAQRLVAVLGALRDASLPQPGTTVLLHGDLGWRNVGWDQEGHLWLVDFEHAGWGHPHLELAKAWDRELAEPSLRAAYLSGYAQAWSGPTPTDRSMQAVRLWAAAGIFPYAHEQGDRAFAAHGLSVLARLEEETGASR